MKLALFEDAGFWFLFLVFWFFVFFYGDVFAGDDNWSFGVDGDLWVFLARENANRDFFWNDVAGWKVMVGDSLNICIDATVKHINNAGGIGG